MRLFTLQVDLDTVPKGAEIEYLNDAFDAAYHRLKFYGGVPEADGVAHVLRGDEGVTIGYWDISPVQADLRAHVANVTYIDQFQTEKEAEEDDPAV